MIVATAGHVDHGKTRLVQALTGVDTDTLAEEKRRGLSIDLGFAYLPLEQSVPVGFIDVPGHERFLRNALCGLTAADFLLLVIAADDGVMPQTREHLAIIDLLGYRRGAIVINKIDLVDADQLKQLSLELDELLAVTVCRDWPRFELSASSEKGVAALRAHLLEQASLAPQLRASGTVESNFRMPIDRVFEISGSGLVVTGTVTSGNLRCGESVVIAGRNQPLRVRAMRVHDRDSDQAHAGQRCALNLRGPGLRKQLLRRGDCITAAGVAAPVSRFDAELEVLSEGSRPLEHWTSVHLHLGSAETTARVAVLGSESIQPGCRGLVQLVCDHPLAAVAGDAFIIRDQSARQTLGGGRVLDIHPPRRRRASPARLDWLRQLQSQPAPVEVMLQRLLETSSTGVPLQAFCHNQNLTPERWQSIQESVPMTVLEVDGQRTGFAAAVIESWCECIVETLQQLQQTVAEGADVSRDRLHAAIPRRVTPALLQVLIDVLRQRSALRVSSEGLRLIGGPDTGLGSEEAAQWQRLSEVLSEQDPKPVSTGELESVTGMPMRELKQVLGRASRDGQVIRLSPSLLLLPTTLRQLYGLLEQLNGQTPESGFTVAEFRDLSGIGRNRCIEILESFDARGITRRVGQHRQLLPRAEAALANWQRAGT